MSILTNNFFLVNLNFNNQNLEIHNNNVKVVLSEKSISKYNFTSFGISDRVHNMFRYFPQLSYDQYTLSFEFKIEKPSDICIYTGIQWITFRNNNTSGKFETTQYFDFKRTWRIRFSKICIFSLINIKIEPNTTFLNKNKILLLGVGDKWIENPNDINLIQSHADNYFFYFYKYLTEHNYYVLFQSTNANFSDVNFLTGLPNFSHCIDLSQRGLYHKSTEFVNSLKLKITGKLTCLCDHNRFEYIKNPNINYLFFTLPNKEHDNSRFIGPASDNKLFFIDKKESDFIILIDNCYYDPSVNCYEKSMDVLEKCISILQKNLDNIDIHQKTIKIFRLGYTDIKNNFIDPYKNKIKN